MRFLSRVPSLRPKSSLEPVLSWASYASAKSDGGNGAVVYVSRVSSPASSRCPTVRHCLSYLAKSSNKPQYLANVSEWLPRKECLSPQKKVVTGSAMKADGHTVR